MAFYKEIVDKQLYVYYNGKLIFKRWLSTERSVVFDVATYDKNTLVSITDNGIIKK